METSIIQKIMEYGLVGLVLAYFIFRDLQYIRSLLDSFHKFTATMQQVVTKMEELNSSFATTRDDTRDVFKILLERTQNGR